MHTFRISLLAAAMFAAQAHAADSYGPYPVTLKGYSGDKTNSVAYTGQAARHTLHNSLKKLAGKGNGSANADLKAQMMSYYAGKDAGRAIIDPTSKGAFKVKQTEVDAISKGKELKGKTYKGLVPGFPGGKTGPEVVEFLIDKASAAKGGYDASIGYDYPQLISKFLMGAVFYNQAVDNYLDEKLEADKKPNNKPYKKGAYYTGKEHSWDEAFGYFGAPAHAMSLSAGDAYGIAKRKNLSVADADGNGVVDLVREMTYAHAYYAADSDKGGTNYLHTITQAFIDGRKLIMSAKGEALSDAQRSQLKAYAKTIKTNWEKVIAEATFKYAGSVYKDLGKLKIIVDAEGDPSKEMRKYVKHWGELKGFSLALQTSGRDLGDTAVQLNRLIGYGPILVDGSQVTGIADNGNIIAGPSKQAEGYKSYYNFGEYQVAMLKVQALLAKRFDLKARKNDATSEMAELIEKVNDKEAQEND